MRNKLIFLVYVTAGIILLLISCVISDSTNTTNDNQALIKRITKDYPCLTDPTLSDWEKVRILRTWTWSQVDMAWPPHMYSSFSGWNELSAAEAIALFDKDRGGVWCGGTAITLMKIYRLFGYESHLISIHMIPPATEWGSHAMTMVRIPDGKGNQLWSLQDAYFNYSIADDNSLPLDYVEFLRRLKQRRLNEVKLYGFEIPFQKWPAIIVPPDIRKNRSYKQVSELYQMIDHKNFRPVEVGDGWLKLETPRTAEKYEVRFYYFKEILKANGWPVDSILSFLFAKQSFTGPDSYLKEMQSVIGDLSLKPLPHQKYKVWFSTNGYRENPWVWSRNTNDGKIAYIDVKEPGVHILNIRAGEPRVPLDAICFSQKESFYPEKYSDELDSIWLEAEDYNELTDADNTTWLVCTKQSENHKGRGFICSQPQIFEADWQHAPELSYRARFPRAGRWYFWVRHNTTMPTNDLIYIGLDNEKLFEMALTSTVAIQIKD